MTQNNKRNCDLREHGEATDCYEILPQQPEASREPANVIEQVDEKPGGDNGGGGEELRQRHGLGDGELDDDHVGGDGTQCLHDDGLRLLLLGEVGHERQVAEQACEHPLKKPSMRA